MMEFILPTIFLTLSTLLLLALTVYGMYMLLHKDLQKNTEGLLSLVQNDNTRAVWLLTAYLDKKTQLLLAELQENENREPEEEKVLQKHIVELEQQIDTHLAHVNARLEDEWTLTNSHQNILKEAREALEGAKSMIRRA